MSAADAAWVAEFGAFNGDSGQRQLKTVSNPSTWRPQLAENARQQILFDGIVHNREELERHLSIGKANHTDDADFVLAAYSAWGENAWCRIKGHFAVVVWDRGRDQLFCVRDPLGVQPLFFAETAGKLILSPCIRSLRSHRDVASDLNRPGLIDYVAGRYVNGDETCYEHIRRLLPGHVLRAGPGGNTITRYWQPLPDNGVIDWIPDGEVQERFDRLFDQTVTSTLEDGPAGIFLSGGLDSAAVAMVSTDVCSRNDLPAPQAFSFSFPQPYDERFVQRGVAARLGLEQRLLEFDEVIPSGTFLSSGLALSAKLPAPLVNSWAPIYARLLLEASGRGCRVMMTGEGADEWLGVPPYLAADLLRTGSVRGLYQLWRASADYYPEVRWTSLTNLVTQYGVRPLLEQQWPASRIFAALKRRRDRRRHLATVTGSASWIAPEPWIAPDQALRNAASARLLVNREQDNNGRNESAYVSTLRRQLEDPAPWVRAEEAFVLGRRASLPIRDPFWNTDLVEFLIRVRPSARQRNGVPKALIRDKLKQRFPDLGFEHQQKKVIGNLVQSITASEIKQALRTLGDDWALDELGVIDSRQMLRTVDNLRGMRMWRIWKVLNLEAWVRANH